MNHKSTRRIRKKRIVFLAISFLLLIIGIMIYFFIKEENRKKEILKQEEINKQEMISQEELKNSILEHYNKYVKTENIINIYKLENGKYSKSGSIGENQILKLKDVDITYKNTYLELETFNDYYVYYEDIVKTEDLEELNQRYKNYVPYNDNIVTNEVTNFYDIDDHLVYSFNKSFDLPIIIKDDKYGVEYNNRLLYVKQSDVKVIKENKNTDLKNTDSIAVLNYHFFYDESLESERKECNQSICISTDLFKTHLDYIKSNKIFTPNLEEFEMYLDGKIQLPKSVVITIDDGWRMQQGIYMLEEYEINATVFLITSWFENIDFLKDYSYIEFHSHGDDLHNQGECPGGQGGAIKCKSREFLINDLKVSSEKLAGSKYFCYPFYEYNDYSISVLKEAGFTMAFAGGGKRATIGVDKYRIPRFAIQSYNTVNDIANYIGS